MRRVGGYYKKDGGRRIVSIKGEESARRSGGRRGEVKPVERDLSFTVPVILRDLGCRRCEWYEGIVRGLEGGGSYPALLMGSTKKVMLRVGKPKEEAAIDRSGQVVYIDSDCDSDYQPSKRSSCGTEDAWTRG